MRRLARGILASVMAVGMGLSAGGYASTAAPLQKISVRMKWVTQSQFAGFYMAKEKGFYAQEGLDVLINPGGPNINPEGLVASGADQFGVGGNYGSVISAVDKKLPITVLATFMQQNPVVWVAYKDSGITKISDFKGKRVSTWFTGTQYLLYAMLDKVGLKKEDVTVIPQQTSLTPFFDHQLDVSVANMINEVNTLKERGVTNINMFNPDDDGFAMPADILIGNADFVQKNPKITQEFLNATLRGWKYAFEHQKEAVDYVMSLAPGLDRVHQENMLASYQQLVVHGIGTSKGIGVTDWDKAGSVQKLMLKYKVIGAPVNLDALFDQKFWNAVPDSDKRM